MLNDNGLNFGGSGNTFGTKDNYPINIFTDNIQKAQFTNGFSMGPGLIPGSGLGDGLRIMPRTTSCFSPSIPSASLDLWTTCSNGTFIRFDGSAQLGGTGIYQGRSLKFL